MLDGLEKLIENVATQTSLGHAKRDAAFLRQVECLCRHPGGTGAGTCADMASVASAYRFAGNTSIDLAQLRTIRRMAVLAACAAEETLLVINDMSVLSYPGHESKSDRRAVGDGRGKGYEYICNLAVGLESERYLGVLHDSLISSSGPDDADQIDYHTNPTFAALSENDPARLERNHCHMLASHFKHICKSAPGIRMVSVADREFDDHFIFESTIGCGQDAVIRSNGVRNVQVASSLPWVHDGMHTARQTGLPLAPGYCCCSMKALVSGVPTTPFKQLALDGKGRLVDESAARSHAHVSTGSFRVKLYRPPRRNGTYFKPTDYIDLNVVVVKEDDPPKNRQPIEWVLYTTLPVDTPEQVAKVVRIYELRWLIESFFKYLKNGFKIEDLRYDNARKTAMHLVAATIAAAFICNLKAQVGLPRPGCLPPEDYARVKHAANHPDDKAIRADLRLFAFLAAQGGWRGRKNDPISPLTLMNGFRRLATVLEMTANAAGLLQEIVDRNGGMVNAYNR
ncbi:MAG: hypothetical protein A2340_08040 [Lentisphaerae bacterium RIFOXYB12_FULL_60_10]|nr:MAG: hypothetical protein A2340_08040 [Lentisphaerae bacterium RIFOXYB12_FULL_60_10]